MPKYYVKSGDLCCTIVSESPRLAALESLERCTEDSKASPLSLGHYFNVNQTGFDSEFLWEAQNTDDCTKYKIDSSNCNLVGHKAQERSALVSMS